MTVPMTTNISKTAALPIDFLIIGAGVSGLAAAIALRRVGHRVVLVEKNPNFDADSGACRMPPNLSKILFHWGLEKALEAITVRSDALDIFLLDTGELIGKHIWAEEVLKDTGGHYVCGRMGYFLRFLYDIAVSCGANFRLGETVESINLAENSATLLSGEVLYADVIIGADGRRGVSRQVVMEENEEEEEFEEGQLNMYCAIVPQTEMLRVPELREMYNREQTCLFTWFGNNHATMSFKTGGPRHDFAMYVYGPRDGNEATWEIPAPLEGLQALLKDAEPRLRLLGRHATWAACLPVPIETPLEDWIAGRVVVVGGAAHPIPPGSIQDCAMAFEDGVVLAKLFSHLQKKDQIDYLLSAYQDLRQARVKSVLGREVDNITYMAMPPSDFQQQRDAMMRSKRDAGQNVLDAVGDLDESPEWQEMKEVFAYDCESEADGWWHALGRWATGGFEASKVSLGFEVAAVSTVVE